MRYDELIKFQQVKSGVYNNATGNYDDDVVIIEEVRQASVVDTDMKEMTFMYGGFRQGSKTIHLQRALEHPYNQVLIGGKPYSIKGSKRLRVKEILYVVGVL